jgi:hypothetical protein
MKSIKKEVIIKADQVNGVKGNYKNLRNFSWKRDSWKI